MYSFIARLITGAGLKSVFLLMLAENVFPLIPSELILPTVGMDAAKGDFNVVLAAFLGWFGSVLGAAAWWFLGRRLGPERSRRFVGRFGAWLGIGLEEFDRALEWTRRRQRLVLAVGRALPGVRGVVALPAGIVGMSLADFWLWAGLGSAVWAALLVGGGFLFGRRALGLAQTLNPYVDAAMGVLVAAYVVRIIWSRVRRGTGREALRSSHEP